MRSKTFFLSALVCMVASFMTFGHDAVAATCNGGQLPLGNDGDLVVDGHCIVGTADVYRYGNVNIIANGILEFKEAPNGDIHFWAKSILVEKDGSLLAGAPATPIGSQNGTLTIHLYGSDADKAGIECQSPVVSGVPCGIPETVWNSNPPVNPNQPPASCVKTPDLPGGVNDCFYRYDMLHGVVGEMGFFGRKVLAVSYGGTLQLFGKKGATYANGVQNWDSRTSWVRLDDHNTKPSQDTLKLDRFIDWEKGDRIAVTSTDYLPGHSEQFEIIEKGKRSTHKGNNLQIRRIDPKTNLPPANCPDTPPFGPPAVCGAQYIHNGDAYDLSKLPKRLNNEITLTNGGEDNGTAAAETRAAVALLTRDIRIVSGGNDIPDTDSGRKCRYDCFPIAEGFYGGHTMMRQGFKTYQVQGVEFYQLGQGGRIGRYPAHFHLARKTPADSFIKDSSVHDSMTRWITIHGTQGLTLARNVGYLSIGHGYYLEDGTETDNNFYSNIGIFARAAIA